MASTDLLLEPDHLARVRALHPGAVGYGVVQGFTHQTRGEIRRMEKRGEVVALERFARLDKRTNLITIPYVRMKERSTVRREQAIRIGVMAGSGLMFLTAVAWLAWESRYVIGAAVGMMAVLALAFWLMPHFVRGCPGLHCQGCKG
jgi:hypothetical protein